MRRAHRLMADLLAIAALGLQYAAIILIVDLYLGGLFPLALAMTIFLFLAGVGIALWHREKFPPTVKCWGRFTGYSVLLGVGFFGADLLLALVHGEANPFHFPGGLLGLPLTFLVCPGATMVCLAGLVRAFYISRTCERL
jgi:hypothetical protein